MAWNHGEYRWSPLFSNLVNIRVADARKFNVELDIVNTDIAAIKFEWEKVGTC
jgi:hypothetical protein